MNRLPSLIIAVCILFSSSTPIFANSGKIYQENILVAAQTYKSRWDQVGGRWTTGWVPNQSRAICTSAAHCRCNGQDLCGNFQSGQTNYWWPKGCSKRPMKIRCRSIPE